MIRKFLFAVLFIGAIAPAIADTGCPIGYGYQAPMVFVGDNLNGAATIIGGISQNGDRITNNTQYRTNNFTEIPVEIGKSYTVATNESKSSIVLATYDANHNFIERVNMSDNNYVCDSGVSYVVPTLYVNDENKWQRSVSDTEILFLDTPLRRVDDYADELDLSKGQIIRNVGVKVFDGTERWDNTVYSRLPPATGVYFIADDVVSDVNPNITFQNQLCSHSIIANPYTTNGACVWLRNTGELRIGLDDATIDTVEKLKSYLAQQYANGTPVTVYYPLATPVIENINLSSYTKYEIPVVDGDCSLCPPNTYKDSVGNEQCIPCPDRLISPSGSTSASECIRVLYVGGRLYPLNSVKNTSPSLNVMGSDGKIWYGNLYSPER